MKVCKSVEMQHHTSLTLALDRHDWSASCPGPGRLITGTHWETEVASSAGLAPAVNRSTRVYSRTRRRMGTVPTAISASGT